MGAVQPVKERAEGVAMKRALTRPCLALSGLAVLAAPSRGVWTAPSGAQPLASAASAAVFAPASEAWMTALEPFFLSARSDLAGLPSIATDLKSIDWNSDGAPATLAPLAGALSEEAQTPRSFVLLDIPEQKRLMERALPRAVEKARARTAELLIRSADPEAGPAELADSLSGLREVRAALSPFLDPAQVRIVEKAAAGASERQASARRALVPLRAGALATSGEEGLSPDEARHARGARTYLEALRQAMGNDSGEPVRGLLASLAALSTESGMASVQRLVLDSLERKAGGPEKVGLYYHHYPAVYKAIAEIGAASPHREVQLHALEFLMEKAAASRYSDWRTSSYKDPPYLYPPLIGAVKEFGLSATSLESRKAALEGIRRELELKPAPDQALALEAAQRVVEKALKKDLALRPPPESPALGHPYRDPSRTTALVQVAPVSRGLAREEGKAKLDLAKKMAWPVGFGLSLLLLIHFLLQP